MSISADGATAAPAASKPSIYSHNASETGVSISAAAGYSTKLAANEFSKPLLQSYYDRLFPFGAMYDWITYGSTDVLERRRREYCTTLRTGTNDEVFVRYGCCPTRDDFRKLMRREENDTMVLKLDIGPVYSMDVTKHVDANCVAVERELVFDIDMDEYDSVRTCCTGKTVCRHCFQFLIAAVKVIDAVMRNDFGFKHILYVFSGRRGVHCWVADKAARTMSKEVRSAVVQYLHIDTQSKEQMSDIVLRHPTVQRSIDLLAEIYPTVLETQRIFHDATQKAKLFSEFATTPGFALPKTGTDPVTQWHATVAEARRLNARNVKASTREYVDKRILLHHLYPRLDIEVSKHVNHLLKAPFCIHPATGKVCVPLDIKTIDSFDPDTVPTMAHILNELNAADVNSRVTGDEAAARTSLAPYVKFFNKFVKDLLLDEKAAEGNGAKGEDDDDDDDLDF